MRMKRWSRRTGWPVAACLATSLLIGISFAPNGLVRPLIQGALGDRYSHSAAFIVLTWLYIQAARALRLRWPRWVALLLATGAATLIEWYQPAWGRARDFADWKFGMAGVGVGLGVDVLLRWVVGGLIRRARVDSGRKAGDGDVSRQPTGPAPCE